MIRLVGWLTLLVTLAGAAEPTVAERRAAVLAAATRGAAGLPALQRALDDPSNLVRRAAVRSLAELGQPAHPALRVALTNSDYLVRRAALLALANPPTPAALPLLEAALADPQEAVRAAAVAGLVAATPRTDDVLRLLKLAQQDSAETVRSPAQQALWPFYKETVLFRQRPDVADRLTRVKSVLNWPLPAEGWKFKLDNRGDGHEQKWFDPALDDSDWASIATEQYWQKAGYEYTGVAWYRRSVTLPAKPDLSAAELHFGAVDEMAWVWINGEYVGQHDIGPYGWDKAFALDVTSALRWGETNQITVRVLNTKFAGGIWKPVYLEALKLD